MQLSPSMSTKLRSSNAFGSTTVVDVGEDLELACAADVVPVAAGAVADDAPALRVVADLVGLRGSIMPVLLGHAADQRSLLMLMMASCPSFRHRRGGFQSEAR